MQFLVRFVADWLMIPVVLVSLYALVWRVPNRLRYVRYCYILMAGATAYTLAKVAGLLWQPEQLRPFELIGAEPGAAYLNNPGFPSDHALFTMFLALAVWYGTRNRRLGITLAPTKAQEPPRASARGCLSASFGLAVAALAALAARKRP